MGGYRLENKYVRNKLFTAIVQCAIGWQENSMDCST